jgi:transposase
VEDETDNWNAQKSCEKLVEDVKRTTRKQYSSEEKIRIVLDGLKHR